MTTGYIVTGRGDLDSLFKPRTSAAAANSGFLSNGGVDLSQRFEPRGATTAILATGFRAAGTDLAQIFMDINAVTFTPIITLTMVAGRGTADNGFRNTASGYSAYGSQSITPTPEWTKNSTLYRLDELSNADASGGFMGFMIRVSNASATPADADTVWQAIAVTGTWASGGGSIKKTYARASRDFSGTGTTPNSRPSRNWQKSWVASDSARMEFIPGNTYTVEIG